MTFRMLLANHFQPENIQNMCCPLAFKTHLMLLEISTESIPTAEESILFFYSLSPMLLSSSLSTHTQSLNMPLPHVALC